MILELDVGNTRIKWRLLEERGNTVTRSGAVAELGQLSATSLPGQSITRIRVACVRQKAMSEVLQGWAKENWHLTPELARVHPDCAGVSIRYRGLGVDRWLAMLAAFRVAGRACLVVDCGTALTLDLLDDSGVHIGGYIVPGLALGARSLQEHTEIRLSDEPPRYALAPASSTEEAIYSGSLLMLLSLLERVSRTVLPDGKTVSLLFLTGGDAREFLLHLKLPDVEIREQASLVLDGLAIALP
jgi:type III pantothenate kinase